MADKRFTIEDCEEITIQVRLRKTYEPGRKNNFMYLRVADNISTVSEGGNKIGEISGLRGGNTEIKFNDTKEAWLLSVEELWTALSKATGR